MTRTAERLTVVNMALANEDEAVSREMIERFSGYAQYYLVNISNRSDIVQDTHR